MSGEFPGTRSSAGCAAMAILLGTMLCAPISPLVSETFGRPAQARGNRTALKPGFNVFSPQQDVEVGRTTAKQVEKQLPMLNDARVDNYLNNLGRKLADKAPGGKYPYQYKCVNDRAINAFALPGGFVYINRGVIEVADNEAQLAAVMGHETSHVALRHGTNQATKATLWESVLGAAGGMLGGGALGSVLTEFESLGVNSVLLKYSRDAERQADILGTQIIYDNGYDPRAMAQFLEKLQGEEKKTGKPMEFFSNHPSPEHRVERVNEEVDELGGPPANYKKDTAQFQEIKRLVVSLPAPPKSGKGAGGSAPGGGTSGQGQRPAQPSSGVQEFHNEVVSLRYPDNWQSNGQGGGITLVPEGGAVDDGNGNTSLGWGVIFSVYSANADSSGTITLESATNQLVEDLRKNNPSMVVSRRAEAMSMGGEKAMSLYLTDDSPVGGKETVWLVTAQRPEGLAHLICVAPQGDYDAYSRAFENIVSSVKFRNN